ncbi:hypothetical protein GOODEAATRI_003276 [Goodea atripinnis]|uniref:Uncharacterized protein n=1 Tax=Goodea atripinnis TaxID=208336 RepID=A0ABV0MYB3_9TELE
MYFQYNCRSAALILEVARGIKGVTADIFGPKISGTALLVLYARVLNKYSLVLYLNPCRVFMCGTKCTMQCHAKTKQGGLPAISKLQFGNITISHAATEEKDS